jgi:type I restriction enzyme S subunit
LKPSKTYTGLGLRSHGKGTFLKEKEDPAKNDMDVLFEVKRDDLIVNITFAWEGAIAIAGSSDDGALVSHRFPTYTFAKGQALSEFFRYTILKKQFVYSLGVISPGGAGRNRVMSKTDFLKLKVLLPSPGEQQKIADCLACADALIEAQGRKVAALQAHKKGLMQQLFPQEGEIQPRLRFPEFEGVGVWEEAAVDDLIHTVTPPKKIQTSDYQLEGDFPIIDQSQKYICGWTNDGEALVDKGLPVIIFGDHTCALKIVSRPFAQGADGIKIIKPKRGIDTRFLFCALEANPVVQDGYKRHFSALKEKLVSFPDPKSGEQQRIADCLTSLDDMIAAESRKLDTLKTHKKGLMQQLFPSVLEDDA